MVKNEFYFILLVLLSVLLLPGFVVADIDFQTQCFDEGSFCIYTGPSLNATIPEIRVVFDDLSESQVTLLNEELKVVDGQTTFDLIKTVESTNPYGTHYTPEQNLPDRDYIFSFSAIDHFGNLFRGNVTFSVNASNLNVWVNTPTSQFLEKPLFAMGQNDTFYLELGLERPATCGFTTENITDVGNLEDLFNVVDKFNVSDSINYLDNFTITDYYLNYIGDGELLPLNLICNEEGSSRYSFNMIEIGYLDSPTTIEFDTNPPVITDRIRRSTATVDTRDLSVCTIENIEFPDGKPANCNIDRHPNEVNYNDLDQFVTQFSETISFACGGSPVDEGIYTFETVCTNLANYETIENFSVEIDIEQEGDLTIISPKSLVNTEEQVLKIKNVMRDSCSYTVNEQTQSFSFSDDNWRPAENAYIFETNITLEEGDNTISAQCNLASPKTRTVTVDKEAPSNVDIVGSGSTCSLTDITVTFESEGDGSPIAFYNYSVHYNDWSFSDITTSSTVTVDLPSNLSGGEEIIVRAKAVDEAGNPSEQRGQRSFTVQNESAVECDFTPPTGFLNVTEDEAVTRVQVRCEDDHSGCSQRADVSRHVNTTDSCTFDNDQPLSNVYTVSEDEKFCYRVYDNAGNNASGNQVIFPPYRKPEGESCDADGDCASNNCEDNICVEASCNDGIKNGWETDVDCGGGDKSGCPGCEEGKNCNENSDCVDGFCDGGICAVPVCLNEELQCGGDCERCPEGAACIVGDDCATNYCGEGNTCEERPEEAGTEYPDNIQDSNGSPSIDDSEEESNLVGLILIILGILMMLGGAGSIGYSQYYLRPHTKENFKSSPGFESVSLPGSSKTNIDKEFSNNTVENKSKLDKKKRRIARRRKKNKRKQLLDEFDTNPSSRLNKNKNKPKQKELSTPPKQENKTTSAKPKNTSNQKSNPKKTSKETKEKTENNKKPKDSKAIDKLKEFNDKNGK